VIKSSPSLDTRSARGVEFAKGLATCSAEESARRREIYRVLQVFGHVSKKLAIFPKVSVSELQLIKLAR